MPRQQREAAPVVPVSRGRAGVRLTSLLVIILVSSTAGAWYFGGQATEATTTAKQVVSLASANVQKVTLQANGQAVTFERNSDGKLAPTSPIATPTAFPTPAGTSTAPVLPPVQIDTGARVESYLTQLHDLNIDRVLVKSPGDGAEYGLDRPVLVTTLAPKSGPLVTITFGSGNPQGNAVYVKRDPPGDIVLVSRYTIDEFLKFAQSVTPANP